ncbi:hypothetical protein [Salinivibrio sp. ES.052]|uniref:hypothetical protein n=1 Tax=Salinivibrio sp. ES.052 TaxID=1882823 RepID=UPI00092B3208|nr:hypothetical protein [Salinivibrio sp. ES.052]SIN78025.1 hypothetical protein SAMN05444724_0402 [Salinivibrio sp. ES.052]
MKHKRYSNKKMKEMLHDVMPEMEKAREEGRIIHEHSSHHAEDDTPVFNTDEAKK